MLQQGTVQKTKKYRRMFIKGTNTSIAAGAKETLHDVDFVGIAREFNYWFDGDDATGSLISELTITVDGVASIDALALEHLRDRFGVGIEGYYGGPLNSVAYTAATKLVKQKIDLSTNILENITIELENKDAANAALIYTGIVYDVEI